MTETQTGNSRDSRCITETHLNPRNQPLHHSLPHRNLIDPPLHHNNTSQESHRSATTPQSSTQESWS